MRHEEHNRVLPKRLKRFTVAVTGEYRDELATAYDPENDVMSPVQHDIEILVDPTEFLDYLTVADVLDYDKEHGGVISEADDAQRADMLERLEAIDYHEVQDLLDELFDAIQQGRKSDALDAIDRFGAPKWSSIADSKAAYETAMKIC